MKPLKKKKHFYRKAAFGSVECIGWKIFYLFEHCSRHNSVQNDPNSRAENLLKFQPHFSIDLVSVINMSFVLQSEKNIRVFVLILNFWLISITSSHTRCV